MTAHDYEDMLQVGGAAWLILTSLTLFMQCAIPVFDGLLPEPHNTHVLNLLFGLAHWHSLAKLRMHTDTTLVILHSTTISLGNVFRAFEEKTCAVFQTHELDRERLARQRRQEKGTANSGLTSGQKLKQFNLKTYKYHGLGDYTSTIRRFGTTESYSTQSVSSYLTLCLIFAQWQRPVLEQTWAS